MSEKPTIRVLIVDDDPRACESLRSILLLDRSQPDYRFSVQALTDPEDPLFLNRVLEFDPHVVLLDIRFRDQARLGLDELLPTLKGFLGERAKIIMVTAHRGSDTTQIMEALGWDVEGLLDKKGIETVLADKVVEAYKALQGVAS